MQVNKRANEDLDHHDPKKYKADESNVAEAALKFEKSGADTNNDEDGTGDENAHGDKSSHTENGNDADKDLNIDSELLSHQSTSYGNNDDGSDNGATSSHSNEKERQDETHAQLSEQLTNYNALRQHQEGQRQELQQTATQSHQQVQQTEESQQPVQPQQPQQPVQPQQSAQSQQSPTSSSSHQQQSPLQSSTQILHQNSEKPLAGTDEWHRIRKDNHKEVERRRRENINAGIKELAALLPTQDSNKSQILQRGIEYIKRLKENENNNIEKWTLEKLLTDQAVAELTASNEKLKAELERAYREVEHWKKACSMAKDSK